MSGTITSADNGTRVELGNLRGDFILDVLGGTTINAVLQKKDSGGNWHDVPDADGNQNITADYSQPISASAQDEFGINVTTATGTWYYGAADRKLNRYK